MTALRVILGAMALSNLAVGVPAAGAPAYFYADFPLGAGWVAELPPYNEHLTLDVGAFYLGFALLFGWAAWRPHRDLVAPVVAAWTVFSALHLLYHVTHLNGFDAADAVAQTFSLVLTTAAPLVALGLARSRGEHR